MLFIFLRHGFVACTLIKTGISIGLGFSDIHFYVCISIMLMKDMMKFGY